MMNEIVAVTLSGAFFETTFSGAHNNDGGNSDRLTVHFRTVPVGGQPMELNGQEVGELRLTIFGAIEIGEFLRQVAAYRTIDKLPPM